MKNIPRKFLEPHSPAYEPNVFFTNVLVKVKGKAALKRLTPENFADIILERDYYNKPVDPEEVLDFDGSLFPDGLEIGLQFKNRRLGGFDVTLFMKRLGKDMRWNFWFGLPDDPSTYPFNPYRVENDFCVKGGKLGLLSETWEQGLGSFSFHVDTFLPVKGNMLKQFNSIWKNIESIHNTSVKRMAAQVKASY